MCESNDDTLTWHPTDRLIGPDDVVLSEPGIGSDPRVVDGRPFNNTEWLDRHPRFSQRVPVGRGGGGVVYRVLDGSMNVTVALKTLPRLGATALRSLKDEFRSFSEKIYHPNIVALYELFANDEGQSFFTMEYIDGHDLLAHIQGRPARGGLIRPEAVPLLLDALRQLVSALAAIHDAGSIHRDIKPSNLMVAHAERRLVVLDFGLAASQAQVRAGSHSRAGTWAYMAPEQYQRHPLSEASDWFAVGTTLYHLLTGRIPLRSTDGGFAEPLPPLAELLPGLPAFLPVAVSGLTDPDPMARMRAAGALTAALSNQHRGATVSLRHDTCLGRAAELAVLQAALGGCVRRRGGAVVRIMGRSGIGKSHLIRHFLGLVRASLAPDALLLQGRCSALESVPYKALDGIIDDLARQAPRGSGGDIFGRESLRRLFPVLGRGLLGDEDEDVPADPDELRQRAIRALAELLGIIADGAPIVLWVDDLQWGDRDSIWLLRRLMAHAEAPLLLLATYRAEDAEQSPVIQAISRRPLAEADQLLPLAPLEPDAAQALATELVRGDQARVAQIVSEAGGVPFFIDAMAREPGAQTLQEVVALRLSRLKPAARELMQVAAVAAAPLAQPVLLAAAGKVPAYRPLLIDLQRQRLLRPTSIGQIRAADVYHDRIRETLVAAMSPERRAILHRSLYAQHEAMPEVDPEVLLVHSRGAGMRDRAAQWAVAAAEQAEQALAFGRAAELLEEALSLGAAEPTQLRIRLAEVLVYAQRGAEAPAHFLQAAEETRDADVVLDLRRRAAEEYIRNGRFEEGMAAFAALLGEVGLALPSSVLVSTALIVWRRSMLTLRGGRYTLADPAAVSPTTLRRLDVLFGVVSGLGLVDPTTASALALQHLSMALKAGEPYRLSQSFGYEATVCAALGGSQRKRAARFLSMATEVADKAGFSADNSPTLLGYLAFVRCNVCWFAGDWRGSLSASTEAADIFHRRVPGSGWFIRAAEHYSLSAWTFLGRLDEARELRDIALEASRRRGDKFGEGMLLLGDHNLIDILDGRGPEVVERAAALPDGWPVLTYHRVKLVTQLALHQGDPERAWALMAESWPTMRALQFHRMGLPALLLWDLHGRIALARGADHHHIVRGALKRMRSSGSTIPIAAPMADLLEAGLDPVRAAVLRQQAAEQFDALGMVLHAAVARGDASPALARLLAPGLRR